jgi:hypothetical protein
MTTSRFIEVLQEQVRLFGDLDVVTPSGEAPEVKRTKHPLTAPPTYTKELGKLNTTLCNVFMIAG